ETADVEAGEREPGRAEEDRQQVDVGEIEAAQTPGHGAVEGGLRAEVHRTEERVHPDQADVDVDEDVEAEAEVVAGEEDQPRERIEDLVLGVGGDRLPGGEVAVPVGELAVLGDLAEDLLGRVVVAREIAHVELVDAGQDVGEADGGQKAEGADREEIVAPRGRRTRRHGVARWIHGGGLYMVRAPGTATPARRMMTAIEIAPPARTRSLRYCIVTTWRPGGMTRPW